MSPKVLEKLTSTDRSRLSRETILNWFRRKKREKLRALQREIVEAAKAGAKKKLETLKKIIIDNTKRELSKIKGLAKKELEQKAKEFAVAVIDVAKGKKSIEEVAKKYIAVLGTEKDKLFNSWVENNPNGKIKPIEDDPKYMAMREIADEKDRAEVFMMLGLIEKHLGGKEVALRILQKNKTKSKVNIEGIRKFFTRKRTIYKLGFWYGTRIIKWDPDHSLWVSSAFHEKSIGKLKYVEVGGTLQMDYYKIAVKGWWAHDTNDKNSNNFIDDIGKHFQKHVLGKTLRGGGYGDEWLGFNLVDSLQHIRGELYPEKTKLKPGQRDSGLNPAEEDAVLDSLKKLESESSNIYKQKIQKELLAWFKEEAKNKWVPLNKKIIGKMGFVYGPTTGNYLYRYVPSQKRVYAIAIQGTKVDPAYGYGSYIEIKDNKLGTWKGTKEAKKSAAKAKAAAENMLKTQVLDKLSDKERKKELALHRVETKKGTKKEKLTVTKGWLVYIKSVIPRTVNHDRLKEEYLDKVHAKFKNYLIKNKKHSKDLAEELTILRVEFLENQINSKIEEDEVLQKALEEKPEMKLEIRIDSKDEVIVKPAREERVLYNKHKAEIERAEAALTSPKSVIQSTYEKLEKKVKKWFGPLAPAVMWILDAFFNIKEKITKLISGKGGRLTGVVLGALGVKTGKEILGSKSMTQRLFDKILKGKRKRKTLKRKMFFATDVKLKYAKIVIPKGKGIRPGSEFDVWLRGVGKVRTYTRKAKKKKLSIAMFFGKKEKYMFKDNEITIKKGTTIPKDTVIPKGARIVRV